MEKNSTPSGKLLINFFSTLQQIFLLLTKREQDILSRRFRLQPGDDRRYTLEEIGNMYHITRERVRQIESESIKKMLTMQHNSDISASLQAVSESMQAFLRRHGGVLSEQSLLEHLLAEHDADTRGIGDQASKQAHKYALHFMICHLISSEAERVHEEDFHPLWKLKHISWNVISDTVNHVVRMVDNHGQPLTEDDLLALIQSDEKTYVTLKERLFNAMQHVANEIESLEQVFRALLRVSRQLKENIFREWGMAHWNTITPKKINDKIYLVMKKSGKPLHFSDITKTINDMNFDHKRACAATVHNELILDPKYVLVGRGMYALKEWGYQAGTVADVIANVIRKHGSMSKDHIVSEVQKQRLVKNATVQLALMDRNVFAKLPSGEYALTSQGNTPKETK
jgi:hypothetical protein